MFVKMSEREIQGLPEECLSHIISLTSPADACRIAAVSPIFRSAAESDAVWKRFLPSDVVEIVSRSDTRVEYSSAKELFFLLCNSILIDGGCKVSFDSYYFLGRSPVTKLQFRICSHKIHVKAPGSNLLFILFYDFEFLDLCVGEIER